MNTPHRTTRHFPVLTLILLLSLLLGACTPDNAPSAPIDTNPSTTEDTDPESVSEPSTQEPDTQPSDEAQTEAETSPAAPSIKLSSDEATALLSAAIEAYHHREQGTITLTVRSTPHANTARITLQYSGQNFHFIRQSEHTTEEIILADQAVYYVFAFDNGTYAHRTAYQVPLLTENQWSALTATYTESIRTEIANRLMEILATSPVGYLDPDSTVRIVTPDPSSTCTLASDGAIASATLAPSRNAVWLSATKVTEVLLTDSAEPIQPPPLASDFATTDFKTIFPEMAEEENPSDDVTTVPSVPPPVPPADEPNTEPETPPKIIRYVWADALNVRSSPESPSADNWIGWLRKGEAVEVLEIGCGDDGTWTRIAYDCPAGQGYVKTAYLSETQP